MAKKPMTVSEVAERLGCSYDNVLALMKCGKLRWFSVGTKKRNDYRIEPEWVEEFIHSQSESIRKPNPLPAPPVRDRFLPIRPRNASI